MSLELILVPLFLDDFVATMPSNKLRPLLLPIGSGIHLCFVLRALSIPQLSEWEQEIGLAFDPMAKLFLPVISGMHFLCMLYAPSYLFDRLERSNRVMCS